MVSIKFAGEPLFQPLRCCNHFELW